MAADVVFQCVARWLPGGRPELPIFVVPEIDVSATNVEGSIVVAIPGNTPEACIAIERIPSGGISNDSEIRLRAKVIDPRQGGVGPCNDVFSFGVVEMSEFHLLAP